MLASNSISLAGEHSGARCWSGSANPPGARGSVIESLAWGARHNVHCDGSVRFQITPRRVERPAPGALKNHRAGAVEHLARRAHVNGAAGSTAQRDHDLYIDLQYRAACLAVRADRQAEALYRAPAVIAVQRDVGDPAHGWNRSGTFVRRPAEESARPAVAGG